MNIALSHISAQEAYYLDLSGLNARLGGHGGANKSFLPSDFAPEISQEEAASLESIGLSLPFHTLASPHHRWHRTGLIKSHIARPDSPCCLVVPIRSGLYVTSPEHLFLQLAGTLSFAELVALGFELCGHYSRDPYMARSTLYNRTPLVSKQSLQRYLSVASGQYFKASATTALTYVRDNSRSPMETYVAMRLGLPRMRGGFGLGMPEMNTRIELDDTARMISGKSYLECDLYYPEAKLAIEYESTAFHGNVSAAKNRSDSMRRTALEHLGIKVLTLTDVQALNEMHLSLFATHVAKLLGKRMRSTCRDYPEKQHALRLATIGRAQDVFFTR